MSRSPLKIAFVTPGAFPLPSPKSGSVERVVEHMVPLLAGSAVPRIYGRTAANLPRKGLWKGVMCERFPASDKSRYARSVSRALADFDPAIIEVENRPRLLIRLKKRHPRARMWLNLHSSTFIQSSHIGIGELRRSFRLADKIIVNSGYLRDIVSGLVPEAAYKVKVVHLGVDTSRFLSIHSPEGAARREKHRLAKGLSDRKVIMFIGRLIPLKGVHHLINAMPKLLKRHPNAELVIIGSPFYGSHRSTAYSRRLKRSAAKLGRRIRFVPYVPYNEVPDWLAGADIVVVPSVRREAFGLVNVEAMASGIPIVAARTGGIAEVVQDEVTGLLADPKSLEQELVQKLDRLLGDGKLREKLGRSSRARVESYFNWQAAAERYAIATGLDK